MIRIRCPHCQAMMDIGAELSGKVHKCPTCQKPMQLPVVPPEEEIPTVAPIEEPPPSPKPAAPEPIMAVILEKPLAPIDAVLVDSLPKVVAAPKEELPWEEFWQKSAAVEEEKDNIENIKVTLADRAIEPLPDNLSSGARKLGKPLASLLGRPKLTKARIGLSLAILGAGVVLLVIAAASVVIVKSMAGNVPGGMTSVLNMASCIGILGVLVCAMFWAPLVRSKTNSHGVTFWICDEGLLWQSGSQVDSLPWDKIQEIYQDQQTTRVRDQMGNVHVNTFPVIRVVLNGERITFYQTEDPAIAEFVAYVEHKASAAFFENSLMKIYKRKSVSFGAFDLDRDGLHFAGTLYRWSRIKEVELLDAPDPYSLLIVMEKKKETFGINAHHVSMARVAASVATVILEENLGNEDAGIAKEEKNPFAF